MNLAQLNAKQGAPKKVRTRRARGPGSGHGKMAGRGHKGAGARKGWERRLYFEGGQMPLVRRLPKRGFNNKIFRVELAVLNVRDLERTFDDGAVVGPDEFLSRGLINNIKDGAKVLAKGDIKKKLTVRAHRFSEAAKKKIEAAGGQVVIL